VNQIKIPSVRAEIKIPLLYQKVKGTINARLEWPHKDLRIALSRYTIKTEEYPKILRELQNYQLIRVRKNGVKVENNGTPVFK
jgi:hypothetical protein